MSSLRFRRAAPWLDAACLLIFVAIGREQHDLDSTGVSWFFTVLWPLAVGWVVGALATRLYTRADRWPLRLLATVAIAAVLDAALRGTFTDRGYLSVFTIVLFVFNSLVTLGWRAVWLSGRPRPTPLRSRPVTAGPMSDRAPYLTSRLQGFGTTIFAEMSALALRTGAVNLGQGFPDTDGPPEIAEAAIAAIRAGHNQYPPGIGIPELRHAIAAHQQHWYELDFDPDTEVLVTAGATEAIAAALLALCEGGDEVVTFEPYYDSYAACIAMAGAQRTVVPLRLPGYRFDPDVLRAAITPRTRLVLLNSPHNPTGRVFTRAELQVVADLCNEHDLIAVTDEVYEHLVFEGEHVPLATLPGMRDRTVTISSAGKTFSFTGWKIGWVCASPPLLDAVRTAKQFLTYVNGAPFQYAIATALALPDETIKGLGASLAQRRDQLCTGLEAAGFTVFPPEGTYFVTTDIRSLGEDDGIAFCRSLADRCGVVAVPTVVFYDDEDAGRSLVRFAFCKQPSVLDEAIRRLMTLRRPGSGA